VSVRLDDDEVWAFLEKGHTAAFTTLREDGRPVTLPVWYVVLNRRISKKFVGFATLIAARVG
jgi:hypothetical protein